MRYFFSAFIIALLFVSSDLQAQQDFRLGPGVVIGDTTQVQELVLVDYSTLLGYCVNISSELVFFQLRDADEVTEFPKAEVRYLGLFVPLTKGGIRTDKFDYARRPAFTDATYNRTALPTKGKGQFRTINILYSIAEFKLSDEFQLGIGLLTPFGLLTTQRLRFKLADNINFGFSNQALYSTLEVDGGVLVGDLTANFTVGDENRFFNIGGGFFYNLSDELKPTHLNLAIGGRVGDNWHLYGEMSVVDDSFEVLIFPTINAAHTVRRHRWRFGIASVLTEFDAPLIPIPLVGYEYHW